jgi:hypothetical protein
VLELARPLDAPRDVLMTPVAHATSTEGGMVEGDVSGGGERWRRKRKGKTEPKREAPLQKSSRRNPRAPFAWVDGAQSVIAEL